MDPVRFAHDLSKKADDPFVDQWAENYMSAVAKQAFHLAWHANKLPAEAKKEYSEYLAELLSNLPAGVHFEVSLPLFSSMQELLGRRSNLLDAKVTPIKLELQQ
jgi:hypothetical protein